MGGIGSDVCVWGRGVGGSGGGAKWPANERKWADGWGGGEGKGQNRQTEQQNRNEDRTRDSPIKLDSIQSSGQRFYA